MPDVDKMPPGVFPLSHSPWAVAWRRLQRHRAAVAGLIVLAIVVFAAIFADILAPYHPAEQFRAASRLPPVWVEGGRWDFLLGTDEIGRDMLSRLIHGTRLSLIGSLGVVAVSLTLGTVFGALSAFYGGWLGAAVMRTMDILLALPALLLAIVVAGMLGPGLFNVLLAVTVVMVPHYARVARAAVLTEMVKPYVAASRLNGAGSCRLLLRVIGPNCAAPLIVQATLGISSAILDTAALGFLGLGAQPPTAEWGLMLATAMASLQSAPWTLASPGLAILLTVLAFNLVGDGLRDALDPRVEC